jgi:CRISPR-associated endonuclease Cas2
VRIVIAFDVSSDRRRYRVVRALKDYAVRVQKSVFEAKDLPELRSCGSGAGWRGR